MPTAPFEPSAFQPKGRDSWLASGEHSVPHPVFHESGGARSATVPDGLDEAVSTLARSAGASRPSYVPGKEIAALNAFPASFADAPNHKLADAVQASKDTEAAFDNHADTLVESTDLKKDAGARLHDARLLFER